MPLWMLDDLRRDTSYAVRLLRRDPAFTAIVVCTLGVAVAAVVTVFSVVDAWLLKPLNFPRADRLAIAFAARPERPAEPAVFLPYRAFLAWKEQSQSFVTLAAAFPRDVVLTAGSEAQSLLGLAVSSEFFDVFGVAPFAGRSLDRHDENGPPRVVLSYGLWQRRFGGSTNVIGTSVVLGSTPYEVIGVMPREFDTRVLDMRFELWTMLRQRDPGYTPGGTGAVAIVGRLRDGRSIAEAAAEISAITRDTESAYPANFNRFVVNLVALQDDNTRTMRATLFTVSAAVLSLLVIASMNVGTLMLGRGMKRLREAAIRTAIGSGRGRLLRQFFTESATIAAAGGVLGTVLAAAAIRLFAVWNPLHAMPANDIELDARVLVAAVAAAGIAAVISGLIPAVRISGADPHESLRSGGEGGRATVRSQRAQAALLMSQIAVSVVLIVATTLMIRTFVRLQSAPLGFDAGYLSLANVILPVDGFQSSADRNAFYRELASRLRAMSGVSGVAAGTSAPLSSGAPVAVYTTPDDRLDAPRISAQDVTTDFFATLRIPAIAGRVFDERDSERSSPVVIINDRAARDLFGDPAGAIGQHVRLDREGPREVIGVVATVRSSFFNTLEWKTDPIVYRPAAQAFAALNDPTATSFSLLSSTCAAIAASPCQTCAES
jgi:predicted permease